MRKKNFILMLVLALALCLTACGRSPAPALTDGTYTAEVTLTGGTGRATIQSPAVVTVEGGSLTAEIVWSSSKYDYMLVAGEKYLPTTLEPGSTFLIPVEDIGEELSVTADTTAMSEPHEIDYVITFDPSTLQEQK